MKTFLLLFILHHGDGVVAAPKQYTSLIDCKLDSYLPHKAVLGRSFHGAIKWKVCVPAESTQ